MTRDCIGNDFGSKLINVSLLCLGMDLCSVEHLNDRAIGSLL